jgi:6,7-dimethyl-8-ribityllumazine synthase
MADILNSKLLNNGAGILKKDACVVLVRTEWNAAVAAIKMIALTKIKK